MHTTMFYTEGGTSAVLVERIGRRRAIRSIELATAEAAVAWCRRNFVPLVYTPSNDRN